MYLFILLCFLVWIWLQPFMGWWFWIPLPFLASFYSQQITHCSEDFQLEYFVHRDLICELSLNFSYKHEYIYNASVHSHLKMYSRLLIHYCFQSILTNDLPYFKVVTSELRHFLPTWLSILSCDIINMTSLKTCDLSTLVTRVPLISEFPLATMWRVASWMKSRPMRKWMLTELSPTNHSNQNRLFPSAWRGTDM